jgi:hypothetical protein
MSDEYMQTAMFVGGPAHGQLIILPAGAREWLVPIPVGIHELMHSQREGTVDGLVKIKTMRYVRSKEQSADGIWPFVMKGVAR